MAAGEGLGHMCSQDRIGDQALANILLTDQPNIAERPIQISNSDRVTRFLTPFNLVSNSSDNKYKHYV